MTVFLHEAYMLSYMDQLCFCLMAFACAASLALNHSYPDLLRDGYIWIDTHTNTHILRIYIYICITMANISRTHHRGTPK